jgi:hypothetical protein
MLLRTIAPSTPATLAVGPNQFAYLFQGKGTRPTRLDLTHSAVVEMGMDAPTTAPVIAMSGDPKYYVARIDVTEGGIGYTKAPKVTISGGDYEIPAVGRSYISGTSIGEVQATTNGRGYKSTPTVTLGDTHGSGAKLTAVLGAAPSGGWLTVTSGFPTSLSSYKVVTEPANQPCLPGAVLGAGGTGVQWFVNGVLAPQYSDKDALGNEWNCTFAYDVAGLVTLEYLVRVASPSTSSPATVRVTFNAVPVTINGRTIHFPARVVGVDFDTPGSGYTTPATIVRPNMTMPTDGSAPTALNCGGGSSRGLTIRLDSPASVGQPDSGSSPSLAITSVTVEEGGSGYTSPPLITISSDTGFGGSLVATVKDGKIDSVAVKSGGSYTSPPTLSVEGGGATAAAIMRAHIRGKYDCYYRYLDDTPEDRVWQKTRVPSSLSPVATIDAGDGVGKLKWTFDKPVSKRATAIELWRTTSDEAYTVYRIATLPADDTTYEEDLSDLELQDFDRPGYAAMPVILPNGELNANRFGVPPSDKAVAVMYQDRLWMAVDTSGNAPNVIRFSEYNEPESCPDINELVLQTNVKGHDHITALIPYGASLGVMQTRHSYRLSYVSQPLLDANLQVASYRGCLNQRCWDEFEGLVYCMDAQGVYAMDQAGQVQPLSLGIRDIFDSKIDFSKSDWFSVNADRKARCLRVSVRFVEDENGKYPTRVFCYSFDAQGWWEERYPAPLVGSATVRDFTGVSRCVYGTLDGKMYEVNSGDTDVAFGRVLSLALTKPGTQYTRTPRVTITGDGVGAVAEAAVGLDGSLLGIYLRCGGYGYTSATVEIEPCTEGEPAEAEATCGDDPFSPIPCWYKSGNMEYPHDTLPVEMKDTNRNVGMLFTPTLSTCKVKLRMYYNNSPHPRINVAARDRGTGVVYETQEPCVTLDMDAHLLPDRISSGVCRALFSSHTIDDFQGNDRHVAFELSADRGVAGPVEIHSVDVFGTPGG